MIHRIPIAEGSYRDCKTTRAAYTAAPDANVRPRCSVADERSLMKKQSRDAMIVKLAAIRYEVAYWFR